MRRMSRPPSEPSPARASLPISAPSSPPRVIALHGASNFRDLGGYVGEGGRPLRWRRLFRSDHLGDLSAADHRVLGEMGIAAAFDFRGVDERAAAPYEVPGLRQHALSIEPTVAQHMNEITAAGRALTRPLVEGLMRDLYHGLVTAQAERFAVFFRHLLELDAPLVFHCTAGKDRTGVAAALVLFALGVPREQIMADYLLTNEVFKPPWAPRADIDRDVLQALWGVQPSYLETALDTIEQELGGLEPYLARRMGLDEGQRRRLLDRYLEPA
jgi:protein-tyrosine phosphatase